MILVHDDISIYTATKPMGCIKCRHRRAFDVPVDTCVRKARKGIPPLDIILLKCKKCSHQIGISIA